MTTEEYEIKQARNKINKIIVMTVTSLYGVSYTTIRVLYNEYLTISGANETLYIITFSVKLLLDIWMITLFIISLRYFLERKKTALKREALRLNPYNQFILISIFFLLFMRIAGSLYTFIVGIISLTPVFNTPAQLLSYQILDDLVFPIRDFIEVIFFSYLFHY